MQLEGAWVRRAAGERPAGPADAGTVEVWRVRADRAAARWRAALTAEEWARLDRFGREEDARREAAGRGALRAILSRWLGIEARSIAFECNAHGKPSAGGSVEFNVSHSGDWALVAVARGGRVGVDVERWHPVNAAQLTGHVFGAEEKAEWKACPEPARAAAFFTAWTLKEAYLKALGVGLSKPPPSFRVRFIGEPALLSCADDAAAPERWSLTRLPLAENYSAALAAERPLDRCATFTLE